MINSSIVINTLFKTIEYKLLSSSNLELNILTRSGSLNSKTISLNSINVEEGQNTPSFLPWLVLLLGCIVISWITYVSRDSVLIYNNLLSIISFLSCVFGSIALLCKPIKSQKYLDSFSNNVLFEFDQSLIKNSATRQFINDLNAAIEEAKQFESSSTSLKSNAELQYEIHTDNVNDLLNSGLIDEVLYDRICNTMYEKFYGTFTKNLEVNNVIYLKR